MRKSLAFSCVFLLSFLLLYEGVAISGGKEHCHQMLAPHGVTEDQSVIIGYGNDFTGSNSMGLEAIAAMTPDAAANVFVHGCWQPGKFIPENRPDGTTWPFIHTPVGGILPANPSAYIGENGLNEAGLVIGFGAYDYPKPCLSESGTGDPWVEGGAGYEMWDLALMYCSTPRCVVNLFRDIASSCGFSEAVSGAMPVASWDEIWIIEIVSGHNMYAVRVPNDKILLQANSFRMRSLDLADTANYVATDDLMNLAIRSGAWDPATGPFDPSVQFSVPSRSNTMRLARLHELYAPRFFSKNKLTYASDLSKYPSFITPEVKINVKTVRQNARDHGEGTALFLPYDQCNPHHNPDFVPLCRAFSGYNLIIVIPKPATGVPPYALLSPGSHCESAHIAVFSGTKTIPVAWMPYRNVAGEKYAYVLYKLIGNNLDATRFGPGHYGEHYPALDAVRDDYEVYLDAVVTDAKRRIALVSSPEEALNIKTSLLADTSQRQYGLGENIANLLGIPH
jgi:dipeptidase